MSYHRLERSENPWVMVFGSLLAIVGVVMMRAVLKLDYQTWSLVYIAAACTAAIRWTSAGPSVSIVSGLRAISCLIIGLGAIQWAGYPGVTSFQTAALVPHEIKEALGYFHVLYEN